MYLKSIITSIIIIFSTIFFYVSDKKNITIEEIIINNQLKYTTEKQIRQKLEQFLENGFFNCDIDAIKSALMEISIIKQAKIKRQWPNAIVIDVFEYEPLLLLGDTHVVSQERKILLFDLPKEVKESLPKIRGEHKHLEFMLQTYNEIKNNFLDLNLLVKEIDFRFFYNWQVLFDNGLKLKLSSQNYQSAILKFKKMYSAKIEPQLSNVAYVDARYSYGVAVGVA